MNAGLWIATLGSNAPPDADGNGMIGPERMLMRMVHELLAIGSSRIEIADVYEDKARRPRQSDAQDSRMICATCFFNSLMRCAGCGVEKPSAKMVHCIVA